MSAPKTPLAPRLLAELFGSEGGCLTVGGIPVRELAERHGTPLFVYDAGLMRRQLRALREHIPSRIDVYYSVKANPNPAVIRVFVDEGTGTEIASAGELARARAAGCPPERILFAGPGKGESELELAVREGIREIHVESDEEIATIAALAERLGTTVRVAVRVNPAASAGGGAMRMGGQPAAFGFDEERIEAVVASIAGHARLRLTGIHMFAGTQILDAWVLVGQWRHAKDLATRLATPPETVDFGGGLGIPYFAGEAPLDLDALKQESAALFEEIEGEPRLAGTRFLLEPGRFLAGPAGVYLARVRSVKRSRGVTFVVLDGGMHHHLAASGNLGQVIKRDYPLLNATQVDREPGLEAVVVGPLCTPLDTLARKAQLPATTRPGDLLAILQSGAYGLTASPTGFLSHPMPAEILVDGGEDRSVRAHGNPRQPPSPLP